MTESINNPPASGGSGGIPLLQPDQWYAPKGVLTTGTNSKNGNTSMFVPFSVYESCNLSEFCFEVITGVAGSSKVALYDSVDHLPNTPLKEAPSEIATNAAGFKKALIDEEIDPGNYFFHLILSVSVTIRTIASGVPEPFANYWGPETDPSDYRVFGASQIHTFTNPLPNPAVASLGLSGANTAPMFWFSIT